MNPTRPENSETPTPDVPGGDDPRRERARPPSRAGVIAVVVLLLVLVGEVAYGIVTTRTHAAAEAPAQTPPAAGPRPGSYAGIVKAVEPSVVSIRTQAGEGSGVVIDPKGDILTNNHVVATASRGSVTVTLSDGSSRRATVVGADPRSDLAVVQVTILT